MMEVNAVFEYIGLLNGRATAIKRIFFAKSDVRVVSRAATSEDMNTASTMKTCLHRGVKTYGGTGH